MTIRRISFLAAILAGLATTSLPIGCATTVGSAISAAPTPAAEPPAAAAATPPAASTAPADTGRPAHTSRPPAVIPRTAAQLAPVPDTVAVSGHNPYTDGACDFCHKGNAKNPGPLLKPVNQICYGCHTEFEEMLTQRAVKHRAAEAACTNCHNPHNSPNKHLLLAEQVTLCTTCHTEIGAIVKNAAVKHGALAQGETCSNCHNPHASAVDKLLVQLPYDLCVQCHGKDGVTDAAGTKLTNIKTLLAQNPVVHPPVAAKDCTGCHTPHGGPNFRLLVSPYPARFYAPYAADNYALCFTCHNSEMVDVPQTTTLTGFRDGSRNLHYVHVNKAERGRTCRACHEVHAARQDFQIRDGVPYGTEGWVLKLNYQKTSTGGTCEKTCHPLRSYNNTSQRAGG